jgi:hypothetical protein
MKEERKESCGRVGQCPVGSFYKREKEIKNVWNFLNKMMRERAGHEIGRKQLQLESFLPKRAPTKIIFKKILKKSIQIKKN